MNKIYSWFEEYRTQEEPEKVAEVLANLARKEIELAETGNFNALSEDMMWEYAQYGCEKELFCLGEKILQHYPLPEYLWLHGCGVYEFYGKFCLYQRRNEEAIQWYLKALECDPPTPSSSWHHLTACYAELGDVENAHHYIQLCVQHAKSQGREDVYRYDWVEYARYYLSADQPERALALLLEVVPREKIHGHHTLTTMAKAYFALGEVDKGFDALHLHLETWKRDSDAHIEMAVALYNQKGDHLASAEHYHKAMEFDPLDDWNRKWTEAVYRNLSIMHCNEGDWEKGYEYLYKQLETRFPNEEDFLPFRSLFESLPEYFESEEQADAVYNAIKDFADSQMAPDKRPPEETIPADPKKELEGKTAGKIDLSSLTSPDALGLN